MPFTLIRHDITKLERDAIVNAANTQLLQGGGVCGAIFAAAGARELQAACDQLAPIRTGEAVITPGFGLAAKYVIHAAGPVYDASHPEESEALLRRTYLSALSVAVENNCASIAFPLISSGIYGYPKDEALKVARSAIRDFLLEHDLDVTLVLFDKSSFQIGLERLGEIKAYINENYLSDLDKKFGLEVREHADFPLADYQSTVLVEDMRSAPLDGLLEQLDAPFSELLMQLIEKKGMSEVEVYKRANLDRKHFSKIRTQKGYQPGKRTVLALSLALCLSLEETRELLERAGFALSQADLGDVIVRYFIERGIYDIFEVNEALFHYDLALLGS